jgi:hypothetical protein
LGEGLIPPTPAATFFLETKTMYRSSERIAWLVWAAALLALAGCATTSIVNQWRNPEYVGHTCKRVLVVGVTTQASIRRNFEDQFVSQLSVVGVNAVQSYTVLPEDGQVEEARLRKAVQAAQADCVITARLVRAEQKTQVSPGYYGPPPMGFYGWYSSAWMGMYDPPQVYQYDVYTSETSLYHVPDNKVVWSGTAQTTAPGSDINKEIAEYAKLMIKAMKDAKVL